MKDTNTDQSTVTDRLRRRHLLQTVGGVGLAGVAGCLDRDDTDSASNEADDGAGDETETDDDDPDDPDDGWTGDDDDSDDDDARDDDESDNAGDDETADDDDEDDETGTSDQPALDVTDLDPTDETITVGGTLDVSASITNVGESAYAGDAELRVDGETFVLESLTVEVGETETVSFEAVDVSDLDPGKYEYGVHGEDAASFGTLTVEAVEFVAQDFYYDSDDPAVNRSTSERFQLIYGDDYDEAAVEEDWADFIEGNLRNMETAWDLFTEEFPFDEPELYQSVEEDQRDGNWYKINVYVTETGLANHETGFAFAGYNGEAGFSYLILAPGAMQVDPPSWVPPHELGHYLSYHTGGGWLDGTRIGQWWEAWAEWCTERYLYSDRFRSPWDETVYAPETGFPVPQYLHSHFIMPHGRDYYDTWFIFEYFWENPDEIDAYGEAFIRALKEDTDPDWDFWEMHDQLAPDASLADTLGNVAARAATLEFEQQERYREEFESMLEDPFAFYRAITPLERVPDADEGESRWRVPAQHAPQQTGYNIVALEPDPDASTVTVDFEGLGQPDRDADWRVGLATVEPNDHATAYTELTDGGELTISISESTEVYLTVAATPAIEPVSLFDSEGDAPFESDPAKVQFPYEVELDGATPHRTFGPDQSGTFHENGGGFVAESATVADSAYVGPHAAVLDGAQVLDDARIEDCGIVMDTATVAGEAIVRDYGAVREGGTVEGSARVIEHGDVGGDGIATGDATVKGTASHFHGTLGGEAIVDGDYAAGLDPERPLEQGTVFGWLPDHDYAYNRPHEPELYVEYAFDSDDQTFAREATGVDHGVLRGGAKVADGTLSLNGLDQYVLLPDHVLDRGLTRFDVECRWTGDGTETCLWSFGSSAERHMSLFAADSDDSLTFVIRDSETVETIETEHELPHEEWTTVQADLQEGVGELRVDGTVVGSNPDLSLEPADVRMRDEPENPHRAFLGRGQQSGQHFEGDIRRLSVYRTAYEE